MKEKIYLDTSIPSAYFDNRDKNRQKLTQRWWHQNLFKNYEVYISELVEAELNDTKDKGKRHVFLELVKGIGNLKITEETMELAQIYVDENIIPEEYVDDAIHLAVATVNGIGTVVSWNFAHMVNHETKRRVKAANILQGYREIEIESPLELGGGDCV